MKQIILALSLLFAAGTALADEQKILVEIRNARVTADGILTGGQPTLAQLSELKKAGYTTIINLRPDAEVKRAFANTNDATLHFDESDAAKKLGITYISLPIGSTEDLTLQNAYALDQILKNIKGGVVLHCGSGNRVGALMALRAYHVQKKSSEVALQVGLAAGLTKLEPVVAELLSQEQ
ncbi:MAG: hypothetical protein JKY60_00710 [Kordiimonadaceae bacterium]|nr:hypothetical protein [Kordiimonadaceae bacterium]